MLTRITISTLLVAAAGLASTGDVVASQISFSHDLHVQENGIACGACHEDVRQATVPTEDLRPTMDVCASCHDTESDDNCSMCHTGGGDPEGYPEWAAGVDFFSHQAHLDRGLECDRCHGGTGTESVHLASMDECRSCHATRPALAGCNTCHATDAELAPASHAAGWESWHGLEARAGEAGCESCHTQSDCQQCHNGDNIRPRVHPTGYEFRHALDAKVSSVECESCHEDRTFCSSCHMSHGVRPANHDVIGWINTAKQGGEHAMEAKLDLESCLTCHDVDGEPLCVNCHYK
jgi:hypothetical protein